MKNACNYQNFNRGRLVAAWIWNVVSARPDGLERGRRTSVNPAALYRRAADLGLDSSFINRTASWNFPDLDLRDNVWKIPRKPEFRLRRTANSDAISTIGRFFCSPKKDAFPFQLSKITRSKSASTSERFAKRRERCDSTRSKATSLEKAKTTDCVSPSTLARQD